MIVKYDIKLSNGSTYIWNETGQGNYTYGFCNKCKKCRHLGSFCCERETDNCEMIYVDGKTLSKNEVRDIIESR